ncbi:MAG: uracil-DNA glycosylase [Thermoguttaceae bacterium]|jgi:uracil-DNA glycosylase family 4|nr:uracil-DNA glycosylase [Thermoguttaceae bacterium]
MEKLSKTSLNYCLSEYLEDLKRAGVKDFRKMPANSAQPVQNAPVKQSKPARLQETPVPEAGVQPQDRREPAQLNVVSPAPAGEDRASKLAQLAQQIAQCTLCPALVQNRTQTVFGTGDPYAELCFVGEGPGAEEDLQGKPFVGRSGQLLTDMIEKGMGIKRDSVFICNIVRCRPPQNRNPEKQEANNCRPFLDATLDVVQPKFICCLGSIAATNLLQTDKPIGKLRGIVHDYNGVKVVCTYHPAYLLRNPSAKKQTWDDLKLLMREMGLQIPGK